VYEGHLDTRGRPVGFGTWIDTSYQGEFLQGIWKDGIPYGPFESMENDTRNVLVNLRIIYGSNSTGQFLHREDLKVGVACVESCVSGNFFKGYPIVIHLTEAQGFCRCNRDIPGSCTCIKTIFDNSHYKHINDDKPMSSLTVAIDTKEDVLNITGFHSLNKKPTTVTINLSKTKRSKTKLSVDESWVSASKIAKEGILFIHGLNHTLDDALKRFGQFLALGNFPPYLKPFVFSWPASTNVCYYWCAVGMSSDNDTHRDLKQFIGGLCRSGIRKLHIMCHSMGARFFLRSFNILRDVFEMKENGQKNDDSIDTIIIQNLIFLNPDYEMNTFINDYDELRKYIHNITIYADRRDLALKISNRVNRSQSLGLGVVNKPRIDKLTNNDDNLNLLNEIDIVDTSDLDRNMNSQFHGYFNINRMMVDDLWELIVTNTRAEQRISRLKRYGTVFRFTLVPSSVVMV